jgi:hypothetical protein
MFGDEALSGAQAAARRPGRSAAARAQRGAGAAGPLTLRSQISAMLGGGRGERQG